MAVTTVLFSLVNTHGKDAGIGSMTIRFSIFVVLHMEVLFKIIFTMPGRESFLCTLDAGAAFLSGKLPMPIDDAKKGTLLHIGRLMKSEEKINDLTENAEDLLLEKERLESIAENAIAAGAPDANAAVLATDEASSAALLAMGIAMEAQTAKELADKERDERARMTSVERAAKVVERDRKRAEKEAEEEAQRAAKVVERDRKRAEKEAEKAQHVAKAAAKAAERDAKWTTEVDATIERMIDDGFSYDEIAYKLGNDLLTKMDIYYRWTGYLKELSGIIKPAVQPGRKVVTFGLRRTMQRL